MNHGKDLVQAELLAAADGAVPGQTMTVGLHLKQEAGWNTYWQYAGDAGVPTRLEWTLPPGVTAGPIEWPVPKSITEAGDILIYGYLNDVLLPVQIHVPANLPAGQSVTLRAHASWLVCKDICIPGKDDLSLTLPVVAASHPANAALFAASRMARLPKTGDASLYRRLEPARARSCC